MWDKADGWEGSHHRPRPLGSDHPFGTAYIMPLNVLVVEDEAAIQELIAVNLESAGHHVLRASNAEQALTIIRQIVPDLVLLDWMLPGQSGLAIARHLRGSERTRAIPIIMLTAKSAEQD